MYTCSLGSGALLEIWSRGLSIIKPVLGKYVGSNVEKYLPSNEWEQAVIIIYQQFDIVHMGEDDEIHESHHRERVIHKKMF